MAKAIKRFILNLSFRDNSDCLGERKLVFAHEDGLRALYLEPVFRGDLVNRLHKEFSHLGYLGLIGILRPRA
jgi:hypothetical protein